MLRIVQMGKQRRKFPCLELLISYPLIDVHLIVFQCWHWAFWEVWRHCARSCREVSFLGPLCSNRVVGQTGAGKACEGMGSYTNITNIAAPEGWSCSYAEAWLHDRGSAQSQNSLHTCLGCSLKREHRCTALQLWSSSRTAWMHVVPRDLPTCRAIICL